MPEVLGLDIVTEYLVVSFRACSKMLGQYKTVSLGPLLEPYSSSWTSRIAVASPFQSSEILNLAFPSISSPFHVFAIYIRTLIVRMYYVFSFTCLYSIELLLIHFHHDLSLQNLSHFQSYQPFLTCYFRYTVHAVILTHFKSVKLSNISTLCTSLLEFVSVSMIRHQWVNECDNNL